MERLTELKYYITKLDAKIENMQKRIDKMAFHDTEEVGIRFLASTVSYLKELREYKQLEEQGLLLRLPIAEGTTVYTIDNNTDACTDGCEYFNVGHCCEDYCSMPNIDNDVYPQLSDTPVCKKQYLEVAEINPKLDWIFRNRDNFGKTVFLTKAEAEQKLKEMESEKHGKIY